MDFNGPPSPPQQRWIPCPGPEVPRIRTVLEYGEKRDIQQHYQAWDFNLSPACDEAIRAWIGKDFKLIHAYHRKPDTLSPADRDRAATLSAHLQEAIAQAPPIPDSISEVFRGESHQSITVTQAQQWVREGRTVTYDSYLPTTLSENEAFNFARDYHHAVQLGDGPFFIPLAANAAPETQQVIYRIKLSPEQKPHLKAAYVGGSWTELLFPPKMTLRYTDAQEVLYLPAYDVRIQNREADGKIIPHYENWGGSPEKRLLITMEPVPQK